MTKNLKKSADIIRLPLRNDAIAANPVAMATRPITPKQLNKQFKKLTKDLRRDSTDELDQELLRYFLNVSLALVPIAQDCYTRYKNERAMYALNAIVSQCRELTNDLRSMRSGGNTHEYITQKIMVPMLQLVAQHYLTQMLELRKVLNRSKDKSAPKLLEKIEKDMAEIGSFIDGLNKKAQEQLAAYLLPGAGAKRRK